MSNKPRVLLVEDEEILKEVYQEALSSDGMEVEYAKEGDEALAKMKKGGYHLVLLDVMLPNKDGIQIVKELQKKPPIKPNKKIVFMTNLAQENLLNETKEYGVSDVLIKSDFTPDSFLAKVKSLL